MDHRKHRLSDNPASRRRSIHALERQKTTERRPHLLRREKRPYGKPNTRGFKDEKESPKSKKEAALYLQRQSCFPIHTDEVQKAPPA